VTGFGDKLKFSQGFFSFPSISNTHRGFSVKGFAIGLSQ